MFVSVCGRAIWQYCIFIVLFPNFPVFGMGIDYLEQFGSSSVSMTLNVLFAFLARKGKIKVSSLKCFHELTSLELSTDIVIHSKGMWWQGWVEGDSVRNVVIRNLTKNQRSLAVSVQRCYFSLIAVKLRWMMFHFWPKLLEEDALKVQDHCFKNIFNKPFCFMSSFRKSVS